MSAACFTPWRVTSSTLAHDSSMRYIVFSPHVLSHDSSMCCTVESLELQSFIFKLLSSSLLDPSSFSAYCAPLSLNFLVETTKVLPRRTPRSNVMRLTVLSPISWMLFCVAGTVEQAEQPNYLAEGQIPL
eukprot:1159873-Pelagomonas_calceolata.AAC.10